MDNLYDAICNRKYIINYVPNNNLLNNLGVVKDVIILKKYNYKYSGPILIEIYNKDVAIGRDIALLIEVNEITNV